MTTLFETLGKQAAAEFKSKELYFALGMMTAIEKLATNGIEIEDTPVNEPEKKPSGNDVKKFDKDHKAPKPKEPVENVPALEGQSIFEPGSIRPQYNDELVGKNKGKDWQPAPFRNSLEQLSERYTHRGIMGEGSLDKKQMSGVAEKLQNLLYAKRLQQLLTESVVAKRPQGRRPLSF